MPKSQRSSRRGSTRLRGRRTSTNRSRAISSSRRPPTATYSVNIVQENGLITTWIFDCLKRSWTKHQATGHAPSACICSENPCSILNGQKRSNTSKRRTSGISSYSQPMVPLSIGTSASYSDVLWTKFSGPTAPKPASRKKPKAASKHGNHSLSASSKKSHRRKPTKNTRNGRT